MRNNNPSITFGKPTLKDVRYVYENMRAADVAELQAASGNTPRQSLLQAVRHSDYVACVYINHEPAAIFGCQGACVWLLSTPSIAKGKRCLIPLATQKLHEMLSDISFLANMVHDKNRTTLRLLKIIGFVVAPAIMHGKNSELFHMVFITKNMLKLEEIPNV